MACPGAPPRRGTACRAEAAPRAGPRCWSCRCEPRRSRSGTSSSFSSFLLRLLVSGISPFGKIWPVGRRQSCSAPPSPANAGRGSEPSVEAARARRRQPAVGPRCPEHGLVPRGRASRSATSSLSGLDGGFNAHRGRPISPGTLGPARPPTRSVAPSAPLSPPPSPSLASPLPPLSLSLPLLRRPAQTAGSPWRGTAGVLLLTPVHAALSKKYS